MAGKMKIGAGLALDGEREFKQAISGINKDLTVLGSEMGKVTAQFGSNANSMDALKSKSEVYNKQIDEQKKKIETLKAALENSAKEFGENDNKTKNWQIQLNKAEAALAKTENALDDNDKALDNMGKGLDDVSKDLDKAEGRFSKFGGVLAGVGAAMGAVAVAAGAAAIKMGKEVVKSFGELEQNLGGSEAVFGEHAASIQKIGEEAYKNMGTSQSDYLATANKMGALFQGSGIEQEKSLDLTSKAMQRAADMASVMGIDMQSALDSVAGAAKGNFTMMDNLGVAMNATNIEAYALAKGLDFTWASATQAEKAEMAMEMFFENTEQYAGNFAKESTTTVTGALGLWDAALESFVGGLGNADADMTNLTDNMLDAFGAVVENITPIIENITAALPAAFDGILVAIGELMPTLLETAMVLFRQVLETLLAIMPELIPVVVQALMTIVDTLIDNLPMIIDGAFTLIMALADGIIEALPDLIPAIVDTVITIVETLIDNIDMLIDASIAIIMALAEGLIEALPRLINKIPTIIDKLINAIVNNLPKLLEAGITIIVKLAEGLIKAIPSLLKAIPTIIVSIVNGFATYISKIWDIGKNIVRGIWDGIKAMGQWIKDKVSGFFSGVVDSVKGLLGIQSPSKVFAGIGENMALGLGEGFSTEMDGIGKKINNSIPTSFDVTGNYNIAGSKAKQSAININPVIMLDGRVITKSTSRIQSQANNGKFRALGVMA